MIRTGKCFIGATLALTVVIALVKVGLRLIGGHAESCARPGLEVPTLFTQESSSSGQEFRQSTGNQEKSAHEIHQQYLGIIFSRQSAEIVARSDGRLEAIYANLGDRVKAGDLIARVEPVVAAQQLEVANASFRSVEAEQRNAEIELKDAEARYARRKLMFEAGLISKEDFATAGVQVEKCESSVAAARAHLTEQATRISQAREALALTAIRAPFEGTVAARYVDVGATVHPGMTVISLVRPNDLGVRFAVSNNERTAIRVGSSIEFHQEDLNTIIPGVVEHTSTGIDAVSQDRLVEGRLIVSGDLALLVRPGVSGYVSVTSKRYQDGLQASMADSVSEER